MTTSAFDHVVTARDVFSAHEDLAVFGDPYFDAGDRLSDRTLLPCLERMVERDDWCGFGQPVALKDDEAHPTPEFFELRRRAGPRRQRRPRT